MLAVPHVKEIQIGACWRPSSARHIWDGLYAVLWQSCMALCYRLDLIASDSYLRSSSQLNTLASYQILHHRSESHGAKSARSTTLMTESIFGTCLIIEILLTLPKNSYPFVIEWSQNYGETGINLTILTFQVPVTIQILAALFQYMNLVVSRESSLNVWPPFKGWKNDINSSSHLLM